MKLTDLRGCLSAHLYFHGIPFIFQHHCCLVCFTGRSFCVLQGLCLYLSWKAFCYNSLLVFFCLLASDSVQPHSSCVYGVWCTQIECLCKLDKLSQCVCCAVHVSIPVLTREEEMEGEPAHLHFWVALVERQLC